MAEQFLTLCNWAKRRGTHRSARQQRKHCRSLCITPGQSIRQHGWLHSDHTIVFELAPDTAGSSSSAAPPRCKCLAQKSLTETWLEDLTTGRGSCCRASSSSSQISASSVSYTKSSNPRILSWDMSCRTYPRCAAHSGNFSQSRAFSSAFRRNCVTKTRRLQITSICAHQGQCFRPYHWCTAKESNNPPPLTFRQPANPDSFMPPGELIGREGTSRPATHHRKIHETYETTIKKSPWFDQVRKGCVTCASQKCSPDPVGQ